MKPVLWGLLAIQKLLAEYEFTTVLDIGSGYGAHSKIFAASGKIVTAIDYKKPSYIDEKIDVLVGDFNTHKFNNTFDCIWCSHILEHQLNVNSFLVKIRELLNDGGILAITVPPLKHQIVGGHLTLWNGGLLLYNLVLAGFNCKHARLLKYDYNISIIVVKDEIELPELTYDHGDIIKLRPYFPKEIINYDGDSFNGDLTQINW